MSQECAGDPCAEDPCAEEQCAAWAELNRALDATESRLREDDSLEPTTAAPSPSESPKRFEQGVTEIAIPSSLSVMEFSRRSNMIWLIFVFLCSLPFFLSVRYSEWYIDELFAITRNEDARGETEIWRVFTHDFWGNSLFDGWTHKSYRPLVTLSYWFQFHLNGYFFKPQVLRVFSCWLNSAVGFGVWYLLRRVGGVSRFPAAIGAGIFVAAPVHVENVVYLVGRADMMAAGFWVAGVVLYDWVLRRGGGMTEIVGLSWCFILAVFSGLSKESGFLLFAVYAVMELLQGRYKLNGICIPFSRNRLITIIIVFMFVYSLRSALVGGTHVEFSYVDTPHVYARPPASKSLSFLHLPFIYLKLLVLPFRQSWDYSFDSIPLIQGLLDFRVLGVGVWLGGFAGLTSWGLEILRSKGQGAVVFAIALLVLPFLPASNLFFSVGTVVGERLLYISGVGFALLCALAIDQGFPHKSNNVLSYQPIKKSVVHLFIRWTVLALLPCSIVLCVIRTRTWRSRVTLYGDDARSYPRSAKTLHQFGTTLHRAGYLDEALSLYEESLSIYDDNALTDYCIAQIQTERGQWPLAYQRFQKIMAGHGIGFGGFNRFLLLVDFGWVCVALGKEDEGIGLLREGLSLNLDVPHALNALGIALARQGKLQESINAFETGLRYDPGNFWIWSNMAAVLLVGNNIADSAMANIRALETAISSGSVPNRVMLNARGIYRRLKGLEAKAPELELFFQRML